MSFKCAMQALADKGNRAGDDEGHQQGRGGKRVSGGQKIKPFKGIEDRTGELAKQTHTHTYKLNTTSHIRTRTLHTHCYTHKQTCA
jgi:hypothetical protein